MTAQADIKLTPKGRKWLEDDKDNSSCVKPQPAVGKNTGSKDMGIAVGDSGMTPDPLPVGYAVKVPPKPDKKPVAAGTDVKSGKTIIDFCEWLASKAKVRCPRNLHEAKTIVTDLMQANEVNADLEAMVLAQAMTIKNNMAEIETLMAVGAEMSKRIAQLESNDELPLQTNPTRYIVAIDYMVAATPGQANDIALEMAKETEVDTPVIVFATNKARELRINWSDAY